MPRRYQSSCGGGGGGGGLRRTKEEDVREDMMSWGGMGSSMRSEQAAKTQERVNKWT